MELGLTREEQSLWSFCKGNVESYDFIAVQYRNTPIFNRQLCGDYAIP